MRFGCERQYCGGSCGARRIAADEAREFCSEQHEKCDPVGPPRARTSDNQSREANNLLVRCGYRAHQVVTTRRDTAKTEPRIACNQALKVLWRHDIQVMLTDDGVEEFGVFLDHEGSNVEFALRHQLGLFCQSVVRQMDVQPPQIRALKELTHQVCRAGAFRADPDGGSVQISKGLEGVALSPK